MSLLNKICYIVTGGFIVGTLWFIGAGIVSWFSAVSWTVDEFQRSKWEIERRIKKLETLETKGKPIETSTTLRSGE